MRIAIGIEYDGAGFAGWQSQPGGNTIQDHLEAAVARIAGHALRVHGAGRTDAGVHAVGQVAHFDAAEARPESAWVRGVNTHLPPGIAVRWAASVSQDFHARFSARSRSYSYLLHNSPVRSAHGHGRCGWFHLPLDVAAMQAAARLVLGEHDFSAFRAAECQAKSPVKRLFQADIELVGEYLLLRFRADAFLHHMVRNLVGALVYVGKGRHPPDWIGELLACCDRSRAAPTFSPAGLYLTGVEYEARWRLPDKGRMILVPMPCPD